jgi:hypothetical protein
MVAVLVVLKGGIIMPVASDYDPWLDPVEIVPGGMYWKESFPVDPGRLETSLGALRALREEYSYQRGDRPYPWRLSLSPGVGLPAFVRLWLDQPLDTQEIAATKRIVELLQRPDVARAIFGEQIAFDDEFGATGIIRQQGVAANKSVREIRHFAWRQIHQGLPVVGGSLRAHGVLADDRLAITSSYFPIKLGQPLDPSVSVELIFWLALQAVAQVADAEEPRLILPSLIGLFETQRDPSELDAFLELIAPLVGSLGKEEGRLLDELRQALPHLEPAQVLNDLRARLKLEAEGAYTALSPIHDSELAIMPFDGAYRLISRVQVTVGEQPPWFVDVDRHAAVVLGRPWQMIAEASYYQTSAEAVAGVNNPQGDSTTLNTAELSRILTNGAVLAASTNITERTIAAAALKVYHYLRDTCLVPSSQMEGPGLQVDFSASNAKTYFDYLSSIHPKRLRFKVGPIPGPPEIREQGNDPEVVIHECIHGFLWMIDSESWDTPTTLAPFGRALQEGYANYFARSIGAGSTSGEEAEAWARAAYPISSWLNRWVLPRTDQVAGADYLPVPNRYPAEKTYSVDHLDVYDVGMVWARTLWDLRRLLGPAQTDWLAVAAYPYLHGYIANFELAAEALLDMDLHLTNNLSLSNGTQPVWAGRGIAAGQGVHGFAQASINELLAATDARILQSSDDGVTWTPQTDNLVGGTLTGVIAVAMGTTSRYAAVQLPPNPEADPLNTQWTPGIYECTAPEAAWQPLGNWAATTGNATPLCLHVTSGNLVLVGTSNGVYWFDTAAGSWKRVGSTLVTTNNFPALDLVAIGTDVYACTFKLTQQISRASTTGLSGGWGTTTGLFGNADARPTHLIECQGIPYVGTMQDGLSQILAGSSMSTQRVYPSDGSPIEPILALAARGTALFLATPEGVFRCTNTSNTPLAFSPLAPQLGSDVKVLGLFVTNDGSRLLVGTLAHGILHYDLNNNVWVTVTQPQLSSSLEMADGEQGLLTLGLSSALPTAQVNVPANVSLDMVASVGFSLAAIQPTGTTYNLPAGTIILLIQNGTGGPIKLAVQPPAGNTIQVIEE